MFENLPMSRPSFNFDVLCQPVVLQAVTRTEEKMAQFCPRRKDGAENQYSFNSIQYSLLLANIPVLSSLPPASNYSPNSKWDIYFSMQSPIVESLLIFSHLFASLLTDAGFAGVWFPIWVELFTHICSLSSSPLIPLSPYQIIVADTADAVSVNFSGRCKFLQI